jgi:hypothetical protein
MKYKIIETSKNIYSVVVNDKYNLAMLFCRVQEFYESPNKKIRNNKFSIWHYYEWYSKVNSGCFSYPKDWSGFNLPISVALNCYKINKIETPYDDLFVNILNKTNSKNGYIIGVDKIGTKTYLHELCHGLYYVNKKYKKEMDDITNSLSKKDREKLKNNLIAKGYCLNVVDDEIQAYMATESNSFLVKGLRNKLKIHKLYKKIFEEYK